MDPVDDRRRERRAPPDEDGVGLAGGARPSRSSKISDGADHVVVTHAESSPLKTKNGKGRSASKEERRESGTEGTNEHSEDERAEESADETLNGLFGAELEERSLSKGHS